MKVGIVGLGVMGAAMAGHLLKRGKDEVLVYDLLPEPVVYGEAGAKAGNLLTLAGGDEADIAAARPASMAYSRDVVRVGTLGHGQIAKTANNMLHWAHCVGNYDALLLAKAYGLDAQRLREVLLTGAALGD